MKAIKYKKFIIWGVTAFIVLALSTGVVFLLFKWGRFQELWAKLIDILSPVIYGAVFAYLLSPVYNRVSARVCRVLKKPVPSEAVRGRIGGVLGTFVSLILLLAVVVGLISMLIPQLIESITNLVEAFPTSTANVMAWLERVLADNPELEQLIVTHLQYLLDYLQEWLSGDLLPDIQVLVTNISSGVMSVIAVFMDIIIGLIVTVYLLNMKCRLLTQAKMIIYSLLPVPAANRLVEEGRAANRIFSGFIIGKIVDSMIIGILCFFFLSLMDMPYVLLVSVIVGVTNVIPFFGPYIGAVPGAFLILLASPVKCLHFIVFIILLQQADGNIIGPRILGNSTGISSFWVLFSILLFGGLFGFVGMIIGVPTFAVLYRWITEIVVHLLGEKGLSRDITAYAALERIEPGTNEYIPKEPRQPR